MNIYIIALFTFLATIFGGFVVFRYKSIFHSIIAFSAGIFLAVSFFDLIPESFNLINDFRITSIFIALGFILFYILQRFIILHACEEEDCHYQKHENIGILSAIGLIFHSFLDGLAIGFAFNINPKFALIVSIAVIAHKIGDGIGLVSMMLHHKNSKKRSWRFLIIDAVVPVLGILFANFIRLPEIYLGYMLAFFAGFFIYIGASDLLPEAHRENTSFIVMLATLAGFAFVFILNLFITV